MDPRLRARLDGQGGVSSVSELADLGLSADAVDRAVRDKQLVRIRRDAVVDGELWRQAKPWERHVLRAGAVARSKIVGTASPYALSHHSALAIHGISLHGVDDRVHIVRTDGTRAHSGGVMAGHLPIDAEHVQTVGGIRVVCPALAVLQVGAAFGIEAGLVSADAALRERAVTREQLLAALQAGRFGTGATAARIIAEHADRRRESAGESRAWWLFRTLGLPDPLLQQWVMDGAGVAVGRVDFLFRGARTIVEFDGLMKYQTPADLHAEKIRHDRLVELGYEVVRLRWDDLDHPARVLARLQAAFARAAARAGGRSG